MTSILSNGFRRNAGYLQHRIGDLTHSQSLEQIGGAANCVNWLVGHMVNYRHVVAEAAGGPGGGRTAYERYARESEPILEDGNGVVEFPELMAALDASNSWLSEALDALTIEALNAESPSPERFPTLADHLHFYLFHDTLHTGQADVAGSLIDR